MDNRPPWQKLLDARSEQYQEDIEQKQRENDELLSPTTSGASSREKAIAYAARLSAPTPAPSAQPSTVETVSGPPRKRLRQDQGPASTREVPRTAAQAPTVPVAAFGNNTRGNQEASGLFRGLRIGDRLHSGSILNQAGIADNHQGQILDDFNDGYHQGNGLGGQHHGGAPRVPNLGSADHRGFARQGLNLVSASQLGGLTHQQGLTPVRALEGLPRQGRTPVDAPQNSSNTLVPQLTSSFEPQSVPVSAIRSAQRPPLAVWIPTAQSGHWMPEDELPSGLRQFLDESIYNHIHSAAHVKMFTALERSNEVCVLVATLSRAKVSKWLDDSPHARACKTCTCEKAAKSKPRPCALRALVPKNGVEVDGVGILPLLEKYRVGKVWTDKGFWVLGTD